MLAAGRYLGRGDTEAADRAASEAMVEALDACPSRARLVIGRDDDGHALAEGRELGRGGRRSTWPATRSATARRSPAAARARSRSWPRRDPGGLMQLPRMYMRKMAVGPVAKGRIDLRRPVGENLEAIADAFGRRVGDITAIVLDRPRHDDLVAEIRDAGARIKLIDDGDIMASISAAIRGTNDHLAIGIGGAMEGVIAAAALRCLGGEVQGQLWPMSRTEINRRRRGRDRRRRAHLRHRRPRPGHQTVVATRHLRRRPAARRALLGRRRPHAVARPLLALQPCPLHRLDPPLLGRPARGDPAVIEPLLYELHDRARARGLEGYRRMSKAALLEALDGVEPRPDDGRAVRARRGLALLTLRGGRRERALAGDARGAGRRRRGAGRRRGRAAGRDHRCRQPDFLRRRRPEGASGAAGRRGLRTRRRGARPDRRGRRADRRPAERPCRRRRHRPGAGLRLAHRRRGREAAVHPQRARLHAALGGRNGWRAHPGPGRPAALRDVRARLVAGGAHDRHRRRGRRPAQAARPGRVAPARIERADRVAVMATKRLLRPDTPREAHTAAFAALWDARAATLQE